MWLKDEGFVERIRQWWNGYYFSGSPSFILARKLKALKEDLKKWNKEEFRDLAFRKKCLLSELLGLDAREDLSGLSLEDQTCRIQIKGEIANLAFLEEISWRQKSRILFVKEGDNNTHFFHRVANSYKRTNHIWGIEVDGVSFMRMRKRCGLRWSIFYQRLYTESDTWRPSMDGLEFARIEEVERLELERDFSKEEVVKVLHEMEGDKAPGPDDFTMAFFQKCWSVVEIDGMTFFDHFRRSLEFEWSLNASFLSLIPKKNITLNINDFMPISLVGSVYKLLSKVL